MAERAPAWMSKHTCDGCGTGYGFCAQYALSSFKCCKDCAHPSRWGDDPWTAAEVIEMWDGHEMPAMVRRGLAALLAAPASSSPETTSGEGE